MGENYPVAAYSNYSKESGYLEKGKGQLMLENRKWEQKQLIFNFSFPLQTSHIQTTIFNSQTKMKIGIDIRAIGKKRTGDETYTIGLVRGLAKIDQENFYLLYTDTDDNKKMAEIGNKLAILNSNFSLVPILPSNKALWTFHFLPRQAKKDKLDVLHVQYISPLTLSKKIKLVTTVHDLSFERWPQYIGFGDRFFLKLLIPPSVEYADRVIAVSEFTKKEMEELYKVDSGHVVAINNGGADEIFFHPSSDETKKQLRNFLNFNNPYILYVGTLQPRKNIPILIESYAEMLERYHDEQVLVQHDLVIAGSRKGINYDKKIDYVLRKVLSKNPDLEKRIHFVGYVEDGLLPVLFRKASLFCFPSIYEGFGLPMIEAMASGTPVLSSDSSCLPEIGAGAASFFSAKDYHEELPKKMRDIIMNKALSNSMAEKGLSVARRFSWEKCATQTLDLYNQITQG